MFNPDADPKTFQDNLAAILTKHYMEFNKNQTINKTEVAKIFRTIINDIGRAETKLDVSSLTKQLEQTKLKSKSTKELAKFLISKLTQNYKGYTFPCDEIIQFVIEQTDILRTTEPYGSMDFNGIPLDQLDIQNSYIPIAWDNNQQWTKQTQSLTITYVLYLEATLLYCKCVDYPVHTSFVIPDILPKEKYTDSSSIFGKTEPIRHFKLLLAERREQKKSLASEIKTKTSNETKPSLPSQQSRPEIKLPSLTSITQKEKQPSTIPILKAIEQSSPKTVISKPAEESLPKQEELKLIGAVEKNDIAAVEKLLAAEYRNVSLINGERKPQGAVWDYAAAALYGQTAIHMAAWHGHAECLQLLIKAGAIVNATDMYGATPLFMAAENDHLKCMEILLKAKADIEQKDIDGFNPLYAATYNNHGKTLKALLDAGAKTDNLLQLLSTATEQISHECLEVLLDINIHNINWENDSGASLLYCVIKDNMSFSSFESYRHSARKDLTLGRSRHNENKKILGVSVLLKKGIKIDKADKQGYTSLYIAAFAGDVNIVKILLIYGANPSLKSPDGTPLEGAQQRGREEVVRALQEYFQNPTATKLKWKEELQKQFPNLLPSLGLVPEVKARTAEIKVPTPELALHPQVKVYQQPQKMAVSTSSPKPLATFEVDFLIPPKDLSRGNELGRGGFGIVFKGKWKYQDVAIKQLQTEKLSPKALEEFQAEMKIMAGLNYPNIVRLFGITDNVPYCMVMEYLPRGDLFNLLHSHDTLSAEQVAKIALDIAQGLAYLHQKNIIHRDLKSKNILLDKDLTAKLADFGLAKVRTETLTASSTGSMVGTLAWMAPEIMQAQNYTAKADIYSFGVIVWELMTREIPYAKAGGQQLLIAAWKIAGIQDEIPHTVPKHFAKVIEEAWAKEPKERPSAEKMVAKLQEGPEKTLSVAAPKSTGYRSNFDSTSMDSGYRDNFESEKKDFNP